LIETVRPLLEDASPLVRAMAAWTWLRLAPAGERERARTAGLAAESDLAVRAEWERAA
jgi:epoxyqueuosine reductase